MTELRHLRTPRRLVIVFSAALLLGGPASGQGPFPPVPGPFPVMPGTGFAAQMPAPQAPTADGADFGAPPLFRPPANAVRMPYWMQAPTATTPEPATDQAETQDAAPAPQTSGRTFAPRDTGATGFAQPMPFWTVPGYGAQGYGAQAPWGWQPVPGGATVTAPGATWAVPQNQIQPGAGYGTAPGWAPAPNAYAPGWGWAAPGTGAWQ